MNLEVNEELLEIEPEYIRSPPKKTYDTEPKEEVKFKEDKRIKRIKIGLCYDTEFQLDYWEPKPKAGQFYFLSSFELYDTWNSILVDLQGEG